MVSFSLGKSDPEREGKNGEDWRNVSCQTHKESIVSVASHTGKYAACMGVCVCVCVNCTLLKTIDQASVR